MDAEEYRMKISRDWKAVVDYARQEGRAEAIAEGKTEVAKVLKLKGVAMDIIISATGLTEEQINNL